VSAISPLQRSALDRAAITLERAFSTDPMFTWVFPDPATRPAALQRFMRLPLEYGLRYGRVTTSHDAKAACVWIPPGPGITIPRMIRSGMLGVAFRTGFGPFGKFMIANETMDKIHKTRVAEPHWYLMVVGVDPERQSQGVGSAIVREGLGFADRDSTPCYLETSEPRNLAFYERLGFIVLEEATLGRGGPQAWAMRRERQRTSSGNTPTAETTGQGGLDVRPRSSTG
jgi:ribosomal protein S18 acetylase RimI-like enzyme